MCISFFHFFLKIWFLINSNNYFWVSSPINGRPHGVFEGDGWFCMAFSSCCQRDRNYLEECGVFCGIFFCGCSHSDFRFIFIVWVFARVVKRIYIWAPLLLFRDFYQHLFRVFPEEHANDLSLRVASHPLARVSSHVQSLFSSFFRGCPQVRGAFAHRTLRYVCLPSCYPSTVYLFTDLPISLSKSSKSQTKNPSSLSSSFPSTLLATKP